MNALVPVNDNNEMAAYSMLARRSVIKLLNLVVNDESACLFVKGFSISIRLVFSFLKSSYENAMADASFITISCSGEIV